MPADVAPPGGLAFHRHVAVTPGDGVVTAWVEDDFHHMGLTLHHDGTTIRRIDAAMVRAPWSTCPGAVRQLQETFVGTALADAAARGDKTLNCTHLHDMALIAVAHAQDAAPVRYTIVVGDAVAGVRDARIALDGVPLLRLVEQDGTVVRPEAAAGRTLFQLGDWIAALDPALREAARLLRWAAIVAHGRAIPLDRQSDAGRMPPNCFTFREPRRTLARRVGRIVDFSAGSVSPLEERAAPIR